MSVVEKMRKVMNSPDERSISVRPRGARRGGQIFIKHCELSLNNVSFESAFLNNERGDEAGADVPIFGHRFRRGARARLRAHRVAPEPVSRHRRGASDEA